MSDERTIEPTPRRREEARREGRFPRSRELAIGALLFAILITLHFVGDSWFEQGADSLREHLKRPASLSADADEWIMAGRRSLAQACFNLLPWLAASAAAIIVAQLVQGGVVWLPAKLSPDWSRLCGHRGPSMVSKLIQAMFGILSFCAGISILCMGLWMLRGPLCENGRHELPVALATAAAMLGKVALPVLAACVALCGLEYGIRLRSYHASLKMSASDLRDESARRNTLHVSPAGSGTERRQEFDMLRAREGQVEHTS